MKYAVSLVFIKNGSPTTRLKHALGIWEAVSEEEAFGKSADCCFKDSQFLGYTLLSRSLVKIEPTDAVSDTTAAEESTTDHPKQ